MSLDFSKILDETFETQNGTLKLSDLKTRFLVLYFYPKDNTPGCSNEAVSFQAHLKEIEKLNASVVGVSRDSVKSHQNFAQKKALTFPLISDKSEVVCKAFDVIKEKTLFGKLGFGIERSTFIIDLEKKEIVKEWRKVKVPNHVDAVIDALK